MKFIQKIKTLSTLHKLIFLNIQQLILKKISKFSFYM